jgi:phycobilisome rod-core linker protein
VPYQRRRILPQQSTGLITFSHMARYDEFYRDRLPEPSKTGFGMSAYRWAWQTNPPPALRQLGGAIVWSGAAIVGFILLAGLLHW